MARTRKPRALPQATHWFFAPADRQLRHNDGRHIEIGKTHRVRGRIVLCQHGLHASRRLLSACYYAPGPIVYRVALRGDMDRREDHWLPDGEYRDKVAAAARTYVAGGIDIRPFLKRLLLELAGRAFAVNPRAKPSPALRAVLSGERVGENTRALAVSDAIRRRDHAPAIRTECTYRLAAWAARPESYAAPWHVVNILHNAVSAGVYPNMDNAAADLTARLIAHIDRYGRRA